MYRNAHRNVPLLHVKLFTFLLIPSLCSPLILVLRGNPDVCKEYQFYDLLMPQQEDHMGFLPEMLPLLLFFVSVQNCFSFASHRCVHHYVHIHVQLSKDILIKILIKSQCKFEFSVVSQKGIISIYLSTFSTAISDSVKYKLDLQVRKFNAPVEVWQM